MRMAETEPIGIMIWVGQIYIYHLIFPKSRGTFYQAPGKLEKNGPVCHCSQGAEEASAQHQSQDFWLHVPEKKEAPRVAID